MDEEDWLQVRLTNLISAATASRAVIPDPLDKDNELVEIGRLAVTFAATEESIALYCEILLLRPELAGFHEKKPVIYRMLTEKLELYRKLVLAASGLHSIPAAAVEEAINRTKEVGNGRNTIIHGYLAAKDDGSIVFRSRTGEIRADRMTLLNLTKDVLVLHKAHDDAFVQFLRQLPTSGGRHASFETKIVDMLEKKAILSGSRLQGLLSKINVVIYRKEATEANRRARNSRRRMVRAKARLREVLLNLPQRYRDLLIRRHKALQQHLALTREGGHGDAETAESARAELRSIDQELDAFELRDDAKVPNESRDAIGRQLFELIDADA